MPNQSNPNPPAQSEHRDAESMGQAILGLLHTAADKAEADAQGAAEAAQQLNVAQGRIAELEAEVRLCREKAERAEAWLRRISHEIEGRLFSPTQQEQRLH